MGLNILQEHTNMNPKYYNKSVIIYLWIIRFLCCLYAERKAGELLKKTELAKGKRTDPGRKPPNVSVFCDNIHENENVIKRLDNKTHYGHR